MWSCCIQTAPIATKTTITTWLSKTSGHSCGLAGLRRRRRSWTGELTRSRPEIARSHPSSVPTPSIAVSNDDSFPTYFGYFAGGGGGDRTTLLTLNSRTKKFKYNISGFLAISVGKCGIGGRGFINVGLTSWEIFAAFEWGTIRIFDPFHPPSLFLTRPDFHAGR